MKKQEMIILLRSAGVDENAVTLATNAWEMGAEWQKEECCLEQERNFCSRCGKRLVDGSIHTCTPPMEKNT